MCFLAPELSRSLSGIASDCHLPNRVTSRTPMTLVCFFKGARSQPQWLNCPFRRFAFNLCFRFLGTYFTELGFALTLFWTLLLPTTLNCFTHFGMDEMMRKKFTLGSICFGAAKFTELFFTTCNNSCVFSTPLQDHKRS